MATKVFDTVVQDRGSDDDNIVLSVVIPAYNEAATIGEILERVSRAAYSKQIIVVDDGSCDGTAASVEEWRAAHGDNSHVELLRHSSNCGKGAAIRTGLSVARGAITLIQDADLEYDPNDYPKLVEPIRHGEVEVVYGSRYLSGENLLPWTANRVCVHLLNFMVGLLYFHRITDEATCYKAFRTRLLQRLDLKCERFEFCPEVTAKICRMGLLIREVAIRYEPRSKREGKKIGWRDGVEAIRSLVYWRFARFSAVRETSVVRDKLMSSAERSDCYRPKSRPL